MRIAPKQTLTLIIPIILIPDWSQTNAPLKFNRPLLLISITDAEDEPTYRSLIYPQDWNYNHGRNKIRDKTTPRPESMMNSVELNPKRVIFFFVDIEKAVVSIFHLNCSKS